MTLFSESKLTAGKRVAPWRRSVADEEEITFARKHRLRKLPVDDQGKDACIVLHAEHAKTATDVSRYKLRLRYDGRSIETDYMAGSAILDPPAFWEVLHCLLMDIAGIEDHTFETWCSDYGCDSDSRKAEATFNACRNTLPLVRRLLGRDFEQIRALDEDGVRERFAHVPTTRWSP